jgi:hypothetical protein
MNAKVTAINLIDNHFSNMTQTNHVPVTQLGNTMPEQLAFLGSMVCYVPAVFAMCVGMIGRGAFESAKYIKKNTCDRNRLHHSHNNPDEILRNATDGVIDTMLVGARIAIGSGQLIGYGIGKGIELSGKFLSSSASFFSKKWNSIQQNENVAEIARERMHRLV